MSAGTVDCQRGALSSVHTLETIRGKPQERQKPRSAVLQAALDQDPIFGRANYHMRYVRRLQRLANRAGLGSRAANFGRCSTRLALDSAQKVVARDACRLRDCPTCQGKKSARWAGRLHDAMPAMQNGDAQRYRWILITPTVRSVPIDKQRAEINHLHESLGRLTKRKQFAPKGWIRNTETTLNSARGASHPHPHLLCAVDPSYFEHPWRKVKTCGECSAVVDVKQISRNTCPQCHAPRAFSGRPRVESGYMQQSEWAALWEDCARLDYTRENGERVGAVLDIRAIPGDLTTKEARGALYEITKYATKPADLLSLTPAQYATHVDQMRGVRAIGVNGTLSPYLREEKVFRDGEWKRKPAPAIEEQHEEHIDPDTGEVIDQYHGAVATWNEEAKRYLVDGSAMAHKWRRAAVRQRLVALEHRQTYAGTPFDVSAVEGQERTIHIIHTLAAQCGWTHTDKYGTLPP